MAAILIKLSRSWLALLMSFISVFTCAAYPEVPEQTPVSPDAEIRVVQFNLRCTGLGETSIAYRAPLMVAELEAIGADSMGFQEATLTWMTYLKDNLTDYACTGGGRNDGGVSGEASPVFYLKDKYNLLDSGTFWLSDTPDKPGSKYSYSANKRICTWAELENKETGEIYFHFNTHLDHISEKARVKQLQVLFTRMDEVASGYPVVLTGDFNDNEASQMYKDATAKLRDSKYLAPVTEDKITYHNYGKAEKLLDYIFISDRVEAVVYHVIDDMVDGVYLSDHFGLYADLVIN